MNFRQSISAYKNDIDIAPTDVNIDDELEDISTSSTTYKKLNRKTNANPTHASAIAKSNALLRDDAHTTAPRKALKKFVKEPPQLRALDKAMIDAPATLTQVERAIGIAKELVSDSSARRITNQSQNWKAVFVVYLDSELPAGHSQNPSVTLYFTYCRNTKAKVSFRLQLNPHKLNAQHTQSLIGLWMLLWPIGWRELRNDSRYFRVDEAIDAHGNLDDLILERKGSQVTTRYYTQTGRDGKIKTAYIGEKSAESGGALYDRFSAEVFRNAHGDPVPLNHATATHTFDHVAGVIRVESRRVFASKLTYEELVQTPSALQDYYLFDLSRLPTRDRQDIGFMGYTEIVRLRGVHGAKQRMFEMLGKTATTKRQVTDYEQRLFRCQSEWWTQLDRTQQLGALLNDLPVNEFLRKIGSK